MKDQLDELRDKLKATAAQKAEDSCLTVTELILAVGYE